ncbi:MAG: hypothetical protein ACXWUP_10265, partial [Allosphingosinicella sp.]
MSSPVAIGLALLLWLAVSAPAVLAFRSARAATLVAPLYVAALIGLAVYHVRLPGAGVAGTADRWKAANRKSTEA